MTRAAAMLLAATLAGLPAAGLPSGTSAKDLGVRGATWPVAEPDLLEQVELQLLEMQRSGELARLETQARERARQKLEEPDPVPGIAPATRERTRLFDPAIVVERDIRTPDGALIAAAGTRIDPLARMTLARDLLFVDGRRNPEIVWALAREIETGRPRRSSCSPAGRSISCAGIAGPSSSIPAGASRRASACGSHPHRSSRPGLCCASPKSRSRTGMTPDSPPRTRSGVQAGPTPNGRIEPC